MYEEALEFATKKHEGQRRKYTGEPYIEHCISVAERFKDNDFQRTVAILHDTVEDTNTSFTEIEKLFGREVMLGVWWLTDETTLEKGNRATRRAIKSAKIAQAPYKIRDIKLVDMLDNLKSICEHDPKFGVTFCEETLETLTQMGCGERAQEIYKEVVTQLDRIGRDK